MSVIFNFVPAHNLRMLDLKSLQLINGNKILNLGVSKNIILVAFGVVDKMNPMAHDVINVLLDLLLRVIVDIGNLVTLLYVVIAYVKIKVFASILLFLLDLLPAWNAELHFGLARMALLEALDILIVLGEH